MSLNNFSYNLTWSDFTTQASRPHGEDEDAFTKAQYHHDYNYERNGNAVAITDATVDITMITSQSWVVNGQDTDNLLQHEQGHYDITALGAREFYNALINLTAISVRELQTKVSAAHSRYQGKINRANIRYDNQTDHGNNAQIQQQWNRSISTEKQNSNGSIDNLPS